MLLMVGVWTDYLNSSVSLEVLGFVVPVSLAGCLWGKGSLGCYL